jgi:hypothetical protein
MESWVVGFEGDDDVERHADALGDDPHARQQIRIRAVSDYI